MRTAKYCKWLPRNGWQPWVLTVDPRYYDHDASMDVEDEDCRESKVFRMPFIRLPGCGRWLHIPFAIWAALFALRQRKQLEVVYISGDPFLPFLLSVFFSRFLGLPTILDFRDSWSFNHGFNSRKRKSRIRKKLREFIYGSVERVSIRYAAKVIFSTSILQEEYTNVFPKYRAKFNTIPNGYDPDDFNDIKIQRVSKNVTVGMAGKFHFYTPEATDALMQCLSELPHLHFLYVGDEDESIVRKAKSWRVESRVTTFPLMPYRNALPLLAGSDIGLLSNGLVNGMGTKTFDYLALGKPVLALVPEGSVIARQFGHVPSVFISHPPHTKDKLLRLLQSAMNQVKSSENMDAELEPFTRPFATARLSQILDNVTAAR